jgi:hypothetical protein
MRTVLALLTAMLATLAIAAPEVAAQTNFCVNNPCRSAGDSGATCTSTQSGYTCGCDPGFVSNGLTCVSQGLCANVICTQSDACHVAGTCNPATGLCSNPPAANGTPCNDGNACTQTDTCQAGVCVGSNPVVCTGSAQCHVAGTCNPATGQCSSQPAPDGTACNDGDQCTTGDACKSGVCTGTLTPEACLDHFKCYATSHVTPPTVSQDVTLHDQFESTTSEVSKVATICTPVDKNGEGILDPRLHLVCYQIKDAASFPGATVQTTNQFGQKTMQVDKPQMLCVPSTKQVLP